MNRYIYPFLAGVLALPLLTTLHEGGHYLLAAAFGGKPTFEFLRVGCHLDQLAPGSRLLVTAAGPAVEVLLAVGGFCWLRSLRRGRLDSTPTFTDWLATSLIGPFTKTLIVFLCLISGAADIASADEVSVSLQLGAPRWIASCFLAGLAVALIVATIRLHPCRQRLIPFGCTFFGYMVGLVLIGTLCIVVFAWRGERNPFEADNSPNPRPALDAGTGVSLQSGRQ